MILKDAYCVVTGCTGINTASVNESYSNSTAVAVINCDETTLGLNDVITVDMGYDDDHGVVFAGRVKDINRSRNDFTITITAKDMLIDAIDYFLVADDPENPYSKQNMKAQDLVGDLLAQAGITSYASDVPLEFIYGVTVPAEFNLISIMDACTQISTILAWHIWCDGTTVKFEDIKPYYRDAAAKTEEYGYPHEGDTISHRICIDGSIVGGDVKAIIERLERSITDENIRNKVTIYGRDNLHVSRSASSPYLPVGFYKTAVIASPLIDSEYMASESARFNLNLYNRLGENMQLDCLGDHTLKARQFAEVSDTFSGASGYYFINSCAHTVGPEGFVTKMVLTK